MANPLMILPRRGERGFTLVELLITVVIIAILTAIAIPAYITVVANAQNSAAKQNLSAVYSAEEIAFNLGAMSGGATYQTLSELEANKLLSDPGETVIGVGSEKTCFTAVARSESGALFWLDNKSPATKDYEAGVSASDCVDLQAMIDSSGWDTPTAAPAPAAPTALEACQAIPIPGAVTVTTAAQLTAAVANGGPIVLAADISMVSLTAPVSKTTTIDLAGNQLDLSSTSAVPFRVPATATLAITDSTQNGVLNATNTNTGGAAIGGGYNSPATGTINIECGTVNAVSGAGGAAIGAGRTYDFAAINISGGVVNARATGTATYSGAAIGGSMDTASTGSVTISGGEVTTTVDAPVADDIGGGTKTYDTVAMSHGPITYSAGVVNGVSYPLSGEVRLSAGTSAELTRVMRVPAQQPDIPLVTIELTGDIARESLAIPAGEAVALDLNGHKLDLIKTGNGAALHVPTGSTAIILDGVAGGELNAIAFSSGSAGIGGRYSSAEGAGTVDIRGGTVTAVGVAGGAGIGAGRAGDFQAVTVSGGTVSARSSTTTADGGAGIGGSLNTASTGPITISGGTVTAVAEAPNADDIGGGTKTYATTAMSHGPISYTGGIVNGVQYPLTGEVLLSAGTSEELTRAVRVAAQQPDIPLVTIKLTGDIARESLAIPAGEAVALDLNGHKLDLIKTGNGAALHVPTGSTAVILDSGAVGELNAIAFSSGSAGIGGNYTSAAGAGTIDIRGGKITAVGVVGGAGIGAGRGGVFEEVKISGGTVSARATATSASLGGAGIGGSHNTASVGPITFSGGTITAVAEAAYAQHIGGGTKTYATTPMSHGPITYSGGNVNGVQY